MTLFLLLIGLALSGAILIAWEHRIHSRAAVARRRGWLKYGVYLVYLGAMISVRWWGWWPATFLIGLLACAASWEAACLLRRRPLVAISVVTLIVAGLASLLQLEPAHWSAVILLVAVADSYAQLIGRLIGRRPLCPKLSPGKTVEGMLGGVLGALVLSVVFLALWPDRGLGAGLGIFLLIGAVTALVATAGDLFFSLIKRRCGVKDFSQSIPGHGGVLDRIDSLVFAAPVFFCVIQMMSSAS